MGNKLPYKLVRDSVEKLWNTKLKSMALDQDMFFSINSDNEWLATLEHGSIFITAKLFTIKLWFVQVEDDKRNVKKIPICVNLYYVSIALWFDHGIAFVASRLGKSWYLDNATVGWKRLNSIRVCIESENRY